MKKSVFVLALLALSPVLYAHDEVAPCVRESVLNIFSQFNPDVLEKAKNDPQYNAVLEDFMRSYQYNNPGVYDTSDLIAVARNFDRSVALHTMTNTYHELWLAAQVSGADISQTREAFRSDVRGVMQGIWATTVNLREYQADQLRTQLETLRSDEKLSAQDRKIQQQALKQQIKLLKKEIKNLKKDAGNYIVSATDNYVESTEQDFLEQDFQQKRQAAQAHEINAAQTSNLQIKTNHKKPVAK